MVSETWNEEEMNLVSRDQSQVFNDRIYCVPAGAYVNHLGLKKFLKFGRYQLQTVFISKLATAGNKREINVQGTGKNYCS
jgi:hypothetical protein